VFGITLIAAPLYAIFIPNSFDVAIQRTQAVKQKQQQFVFTRTIEEIKGNTTLLVAQMQQTIKISGAYAISNRTQIVSNALSKATTEALNTEKNAVKGLQSTFGKSGGTFALGFIWNLLL
jgi:hypothetical protein